MIKHPQNWAGNYTYQATHLHQPETLEQVQELVSRSRKIKALGSRHSFNEIADSPEDLISLEHFDKVLTLDSERHTVTVEGGIRYGELSRWLYDEGFALHNLASLPHISVAGACATATHGSGDQNGNLATAVAAIELVTANGEIVVLSREDQSFYGAVVGLGGLGIVTKLTLNIQPTFDMEQDIYQNLPLAQLTNHFDELVSSAYSVSLFTNWRNKNFNQVWIKSRTSLDAFVEPKLDLFEATLAMRDLHPIETISAESCTPQMGVRGPWHERLPHFKMNFTPSSGEELQSEYFIPRQHALSAISAVEQIRERIALLLQISEIRTIAADMLWMSPCFKQDCVAIHFTWKKDWEAVQKILPLIEEKLARFNARPHWGKLFTMQPSHIQSLYEKLPDFRELLQQYDPEGKFRNLFLDQYIFGVS